MNPSDVYNRSKEMLELEPSFSLEYAKELGAILRFHERKYYIDNESIISDTEYDLLFKKLQEVEAKHPEYTLPDSPTQRVSSDLTSEFVSVEHIVPMLSLENSYNEEDLQKFDDQIHKLTGIDPNTPIAYTVEPKFDGGSVAVIYENDILVRAATRGNGAKGEDFTLNAKQIQTLPLRADFSKHGLKKVELRGEAVIDKAVFAEINLKRQEEGKTLFANPRNTAAGGLRTKDPRETKERGTEIFIFQIGYGADDSGNDIRNEFGGHFESLKALGQLGFKTDQNVVKKCIGIGEVMKHVRLWEEKRESYPYEIDGMVVKVDDFALQERCGSTSHHPRWAIAFKFKAKQATTTLENVVYQVGKIGSITPVAKVTPVALAGVTVSSISLHNEDFIQSKDLRLGDKIIIERAGDVIPYIVKSLPDLRSGEERPIEFPKTCPSCGTGLQRIEGEAAWRCPNTLNCPEQFLQRLYHHVSKDAMDIDGLGPSQVLRFYQEGWVNDVDDLYTLNYDEIAKLDGFGEKSAQKLAAAIERAKQNPLHRLLYSLSIHHLGKKVSKILSERVEHALDLVNWTVEDFTAIHEVGPVVAQNVVDFFNQDHRLDMLRRLESKGVNLHQLDDDKPLEVSVDAPLVGKTILFTGSLQQMTRKQAQELAAQNGAQNISAVSSNLNILVVGEKAGSKLKKAQALGSVQILSEDEFLALIQG